MISGLSRASRCLRGGLPGSQPEHVGDVLPRAAIHLAQCERLPGPLLNSCGLLGPLRDSPLGRSDPLAVRESGLYLRASSLAVALQSAVFSLRVGPLDFRLPVAGSNAPSVDAIPELDRSYWRLADVVLAGVGLCCLAEPLDVDGTAAGRAGLVVWQRDEDEAGVRLHGRTTGGLEPDFVNADICSSSPSASSCVARGKAVEDVSRLGSRTLSPASVYVRVLLYRVPVRV